MVRHTAEAMARGGIYDQLAGGFARYASTPRGSCRTSRRCCTTMRCCCAATPTVAADRGRAGPPGRRGDRRLHGRDCAPRKAVSPRALDADADGEEGSHLRVDPRAVARRARRGRRAWAAEFSVSPRQGTFEDGASVLQLPCDPDDRSGTPASAAALRGPRRRVPAGPRRQGRHRLERAGDHGARRGRRAVGPSGPGGAGPGGGSPGGGTCTTRTGGLVRCPATGSLARAPECLRTTATSRKGSWRCRGDRGEPCGWRCAGTAGHRARPSSCRFGRCSDTADDAEAPFTGPASPTDDATPSGGSAAAGALLCYAALHRIFPASGRRGSRVRRGQGAGREDAEVHRVGNGGRGGGARRTARNRRSGPQGDPVAEELHRTALLGTSPGQW